MSAVAHCHLFQPDPSYTMIGGTSIQFNVNPSALQIFASKLHYKEIL